MRRKKRVVAKSVGVMWLVAGALALADSARAEPGDDRYTFAAGLYNQNRYALASQEFQKFVKAYPNHAKAPDALFFLAESYFQLNKTDEARTVLRELVRKHAGTDHLRRAMFRIGEASYLLGDQKAAERELGEFLRKFPKDPLAEHALAYLAHVELELGRLEEARGHFQRLLDTYPKSARAEECRYALAQTVERLGDERRAIELYRAVAAKTDSPLADDAQLNLGARLFAEKRLEAAATAFAELPQRFPKSELVDTARLNQGMALYQLDRADQAAALFEALRDSPSVGPEARYWLGLAHKARKQWRLAANVLKEAAEKFPNSPLAGEMMFHSADALLQAGAYGEALPLFLSVSERWPRDELADDSLLYAMQAALQAGRMAEVHRIAGRFGKQFPKSGLRERVAVLDAQAYSAAKQFGEATKALVPLVEGRGNKPGSPEVQYQLAVAYHGAGNFDRALKALEAMAGLAADHALAAERDFLAGSCWYAKEDFAKAGAALEAYLKEAPKGEMRAHAWAMLAICQGRLGQFEGAERTVAQLTAAAPGHAVVGPTLVQLSELAFGAKNYAVSERLYERLAQRGQADAYHARALSGLGWSQYEQAQYQKAADTLERLIKGHPKDGLVAEGAYVRGLALEALGRPAEAVGCYELVVAEFPGSPQAFPAALQAARAAVKAKQVDKAAEAYARVVERFGKEEKLDEVLYEWAWLYLDQKQEAKANELFGRLAEKFPESPLAAEAKLNVGEAAYQAKRFEEALRLLEGLADQAREPRVKEAALYRLGRTAVELGKWDLCRRTFERLGRESGRYKTESEFWSAEADYREGKYVEAGRRFAELCRLSAETYRWVPTAWLRLAQTHAGVKDWRATLETTGSLRQRFAQYEMMYEVDYLEGRALQNQARFDQARAAYGRVMGADSRGAKTETAAQAQFMIGETYFHQKNYQAALVEFLKVSILYRYPTWQAAALLEAGKCHERLGQSAEAAQTYKQLLKDFPKSEHAGEAARRLGTGKEQARS